MREHKLNTKSSFQRVKDKHRDYDARMREHDARIRELEGLISSMQMLEAIEVPKPTIKKKRKKAKKR